MLLVIAMNLTLGTIAAHYCIDHWLHKDIGYFTSMLIGLVAGEVVIPACIVTWLLVLAGVIN